MASIKLALVSYINTIPFIDGIKNDKLLNSEVELYIDFPANCAKAIKNGSVDGGLLPVGALDELPKDYQIISDFCIGSDGPVETVVLLSQEPIHKLHTIYLDYQSRTSVRLVQVLAQNYWKQQFKYLPTAIGFENNLPEGCGMVLIGDRVFEKEQYYPYRYDLSDAWKKYQNLPFVFAVWVGNEKVKEIESSLNKAFRSGIDNIEHSYNNLLTIDKERFINYLTKSISYSFTQEKKEAIKLFKSLLVTR
ncbi:MAG: menaquinone biosynthesis protein [Bacteroidales bacterium]|nr:menaquinone biosynthesis protein [Bacteroidales bacterium]